MHRRAFALPLVILLALIGTLMVTLLMDRHGNLHRASVRQIDDYVNHHRSAGVQEAVLRWLDTARGKLRDSIGADGLAFSMVMPGSGQVDVFMTDAQGAALSDASSVSGRQREIVEDMTAMLDELPEDLKVNGLQRIAGPAAISVNTAPALVIQALCMAIIPERDQALAAATAILKKRGDGELRAGDIQQALQPLNISATQGQEFQQMLVFSPTLYRVEARTRTSRGQVLDVSAGLYEVDESRIETFKQSGGFLTWDQVPEDQISPGGAGRR